MELNLQRKNALVTGGATGLGRELVRSLVKEGVNVCFTYRSHPEAALALVEELNGLDAAHVVAIQTNLGNSQEIDALFEQGLTHFKQFDILINNAGIWPTGRVADITLKEWDNVMNINLKSVFHLSQLFINQCSSKQITGSVLNITSQAAFHGSTTGHSHYAASKAGLVAFSISLAREVAKQGINVNNIAVGIMDTEMIRGNLEKDPQYYLNRIPVGRVASPTEIADIGVFLVSEKASYMTGATIDVTGGMLMR
uniref:SDR family oxidoreductase n=1 Tax=Providencia stuartii TaxID=588 RepID=A0AAI9GJL3_PROST|nr:SDR family oxidoreductase [Providencia stuartii]